MSDVANTILAQLGGGKFQAMTGARIFVAMNEQRGGLQFKLPRGAKDGVNFVQVILTADDTYTVKFSKFRNLEVKLVAEYTSVYADQLRRIFTEATGLDTSL